MKPHHPNSIPLKLRALSAVVVLALLLYCLAALLTGYTYFPSKRGGFFLAGVPLLMVVFAATCACVAAMLTILDHYDRRPNEAAYVAAKATSLKLALLAFFAAPVVQLLDVLFQLGGLDVFPRFHGFAHQYTLYSPQLRAYLPYVDPMVDASAYVAIASFVLLGIGWLIHKFYEDRARRAVLVMLSLGLLGLSIFFLASSTKAFLTGEVKAGSRRHRTMVTAEAQPAKFNAVLLMHFALGGVLVVGSVTMLVAAGSGRLPVDGETDIRLSPRPRVGQRKAKPTHPPKPRGKRSRGK